MLVVLLSLLGIGGRSCSNVLAPAILCEVRGFSTILQTILRLKLQVSERLLPGGSNVFALWICYGYPARDSKLIPKKEVN